MKIGVFSTHIHWQTHYETELEIIQNEINDGNELLQFYCNKQFKSCDIISDIVKGDEKKYHKFKNRICAKCVKKQKIGKKLLSRSIESFPIISSFKYYPKFDDYYLFSHKNLKELKIGNFDIGWGILSSLISITQDPDIDLSKHKNLVYKSYNDCLNLYYNTINFIRKYKLKKIYVFNGRFSHTRAIFKAAINEKIDCYIHERGSSNDKYSISKNHFPHDIEMFKLNVENLWKSEPNVNIKIKTATDFYIGKRNGEGGSWKSYIELQESKKLPDLYLHTNKQKIVFFTSSDDEFESIDETYNQSVFKKQIDAVKYICDLILTKKINNYILCVRMHPNSKRMGDNYIKNYLSLHNEGRIEIIKPDSNISTYALLDSSDLIITFGSTIGYEAVFNNKKVIELGKSLYSKISGPFRPESHDELYNSLLYNNFITDNSDILKLGYYLKNFGINYKFYEAINYMNGTFRKQNLNNVKLNVFEKIIIKLKDMLFYES